MKYETALAWLRGERSTINHTYGPTPGEAQERAHRQDASMVEQAYWVVRAHREGLTGGSAELVDIVFDGPPGPEPGRFVEVESQDGSSVSVGKWIERDDGYWVLRLMSEVSS